MHRGSDECEMGLVGTRHEIGPMYANGARNDARLSENLYSAARKLWQLFTGS